MSPSVLVVEDYTDLRAAIAEALERGHYTCDQTSSAGAISKLRENRYSTILLAPTLPITDDPVMHFLLEEQPDQVSKVVLMTDPDREDEAGSTKVLLKPFNNEQLLAKIGE
jgi:DNA-binding response OmpR family regulator